MENRDEQKIKERDEKNNNKKGNIDTQTKEGRNKIKDENTRGRENTYREIGEKEDKKVSRKKKHQHQQ